ncbi:right-handed parallel beta-helix repeat-containing protein [Shewanella sp. 10N.7]|uniref:right-handed parallel beta-helix repeat-containing protein n=1 Tax=Shewanella sp. 10N.7 TaxID=2885093 RepID=UPI001E2C786F|nr:right-handed parallel beta-helix repeat-containing protein [Shewanella sp. 10N.7]MCC4831795.1 right-handed parallel beta-helix repeat-containing protein [Shewanella sp. 10N.7]
MKATYCMIFCLLLTLFCHNVYSSPAADFYLSPQGSDSWSGTLPTANSDRTDGPFATLTRARDAVRTLKNHQSSDILVAIRGGNYVLSDTVVFGLEDSGAKDSTITYSAYKDETPVFTSGRKITGWKKLTKKLPSLPDTAQGKVLVANVKHKFFTLYDEQGLLPRAQSEHIKPLAGGSKNHVVFPAGRLKNWSNVEDIEISVRPTRAWIMNVLPLTAVDAKTGIAQTAIPATYGMNKKGVWLENVLEELDQPGEWVLNSKEGKVYLWPRNNSDVYAPQLIEFIRVEGAIDKQGPTDTPVRHLKFSGLTFKHGERFTLAKGDQGLQHDWNMFDKANALIRFRGTENCTIENSHFLHSGSGAIRIDLYGINNTIANNHIEGLGGSGILLSGYGPGTKDVNKNNLVYNNHIHDVGKIYWHSPGIFVNQSGDNRVANNLIHDTNYSGLIISGLVTRFFIDQDRRESSRTIRWHEIAEKPKKNPTLDEVKPYLHTKNNLIEYNEIHHVMNILGDGNGIYIRGAGAGNVIRHNYIHHLESDINAQSAIRTDGGQMDTLISQNLMYKTKSQGMTLKLNNRFENNIIADVIAPRGVYFKIVEGPMIGATNKRNIFYSSNPDCQFISQPGGGTAHKFGEDRRGRQPARMKDIDSDDNIYFCKQDLSKSGEILADLQKEGIDENSLNADPLFVDAANGDFRFKQDSPALKMGITEFDISKVGLRRKTNK